MSSYVTQNDLLLKNLKEFYSKNDRIDMMLRVINGDSKISLRIVDWFVTNYAKEKYIVYELADEKRIKVYDSYKLNLRAYSKKRFDPFCRWEHITIPYKEGVSIQTTLGQLNFFKWALENKVIKYIQDHYSEIEADMNARNSTSKRRNTSGPANKTRKKREELSISASKTIHREEVEIVVKFN